MLEITPIPRNTQVGQLQCSADSDPPRDDRCYEPQQPAPARCFFAYLWPAIFQTLAFSYSAYPKPDEALDRVAVRWLASALVLATLATAAPTAAAGPAAAAPAATTCPAGFLAYGVVPLQGLVAFVQNLGITSDAIRKADAILGPEAVRCVQIAPVPRPRPALHAEAHDGVAAPVVGGLVAFALALGALVGWLGARRRLRRGPQADREATVPSGDRGHDDAPRDPARAEPAVAAASNSVRLLVRPAKGRYTKGTSLTRLSPRGYVLVQEHLAVLAEATSCPLIDRDQPVVIQSS